MQYVYLFLSIAVWWGLLGFIGKVFFIWDGVIDRQDVPIIIILVFVGLVGTYALWRVRHSMLAK